MATEVRGLCVGTLSASADLSAQVYKFVKVSGSRTVTVCAANTDRPIGVLQNKPTSGQPADVMVTGVTKMVAGAAITAGQELMSDASGRAIPLTANAGNNRSYGVALEDASGANIVFEALLPGVAKAL